MPHSKGPIIVYPREVSSFIENLTSHYELLLFVRRAPRDLEGGPSEHQYLPKVGRVVLEDCLRCVAGGHRGRFISAASVPLFAAPPCTAVEYSQQPDLAIAPLHSISRVRIGTSNLFA